MYMHGVDAWCLQSPEEGARSLGTGVAGACEPVCGCWEMNFIRLQEQVLLIAEPPDLYS